MQAIKIWFVKTIIIELFFTGALIIFNYIDKHMDNIKSKFLKFIAMFAELLCMIATISVFLWLIILFIFAVREV